MNAIRVTDNHLWVVERFFDEGDAVWPGVKLMDVMGDDGVLREIISDTWGRVVQIAGKKLRARTFEDVANATVNLWPDDDGSDLIRLGGGLGSVYPKDALICQTEPHRDPNTIKGGKPHPSTSRSISNAKAEGRLIPTFG
jgi:hypothetical protein